MADKPKVELEITQDKRLLIVDSIAHQIPYGLASEAHGIPLSVFESWIFAGRRDCLVGVNSAQAQFFQDVKNAEMKCIRTHLDLIAARPDNWEAHAWLLERRWPRFYGEFSNDGQEEAE